MRLRSAALVCASLSLAPAARAQPSFTWLELLPGSEANEATAISANGCVVLGSSGSRAVRWVSGSIEALRENAGSGAAASADGSVLLANDWSRPGHWFVEDHRIALSMRPPAGYGALWAGGISADGRVAAGDAVAPADPHHPDLGPADAVRYEGGVLTVIASADSTGSAHAAGVSADGSVVVGNRGSNAFRWEAGNLVDLGSGRATALSADGSVVVGESSGDAFRWADGVRQGIGRGVPFDVSGDGSVTVGYADFLAVYAAAAWIEVDYPVRMTDLLAAWGIDAAGLDLTEATAVSDDGLTIVGKGIDPQGRRRAWLATRVARDCSAPEPPPAPPATPLPAPTSFLGAGPPWASFRSYSLAVAPDGVPYAPGTLNSWDEATGEGRSVEGVHEIATGGGTRTIIEGDFGGVAADGESVVAVSGPRMVRISREDDSLLADTDLGPGIYTAGPPALDPWGNALAWIEIPSGFPDDCFGVAALTRSGYAGLLTDSGGSPCIGALAGVEWLQGALHWWTLEELWRLEADGTRTTVLAAGDGLRSVGPHAFDAVGNLYAADPVGLAVYKSTPSGERIQILDRDGDLVGHPLEQWIVGLVVDGRGHVLVTDGSRIFEIFPNGAIQVAASPYAGEGRAQLSDRVERIALDSAGNLYAMIFESDVLGIPPSSEVPEPAEPDRDGDGLLDVVDNCDVYPNPDQRDADGDGWGSACDADFDQNGLVGASDLARLAASFGSRTGDPAYDPRLDMNADGVIGPFEYAALASSLGGPPGTLRP